MKKIRLFLSTMLAMMMTTASAQSIIARPVETTVGSQAELNVRILSCTSMTSLQFNIHLPEGLSYTTQGGDYGFVLEKAAPDHTLHIEKLDNGDLFVLVYSRNFTKFKYGDLLTIPVTAGSNPIKTEGEVYQFRTATADAVSYQGKNSYLGC